ncbi:hypothetical protein DdX_20631 [Ditylenchus destructor]|uniref:Uncharacterized protein n=1 Tax=Ditylenchus destructor TaxID=166010 RepID=A0AAD4MHR1_9BILA|nr:hypothetical protein DdX_20631 [Ditylenchus destructor]
MAVKNPRSSTESELEASTQAVALSKEPQVVKGRGVVCAVEDHQCFVYCHDCLVELYFGYVEERMRLELAQWIVFTAEERPDGTFEILDYEEIDPVFPSIPFKSTIMVRCSVQVPIDIWTNSNQWMDSDVSKRVFCKNMNMLYGCEGKTIQAYVQYVYEEKQPCGYWLVDWTLNYYLKCCVY